MYLLLIGALVLIYILKLSKLWPFSVWNEDRESHGSADTNTSTQPPVQPTRKRTFIPRGVDDPLAKPAQASLIKPASKAPEDPLAQAESAYLKEIADKLSTLLNYQPI